MTLSTQNHAKPLEKLNYGFKRTINWNKYQSKKSREERNQYFDYLIDPSFQGVNRLFVLSFEDKGQRSALSSDCRNKKLCYDLWTKMF